jgi:hypothetical protein
MSDQDMGGLLARSVKDESPAKVDDADGARHHVDVYGRLVTFERTVLVEMRRFRDAAPPELQPMIDSSDIRPMEQLIEEFDLRREAWARRLEELGRNP